MGAGCAIEETWESGQKELRIIDVLEPIIARGSLVFNDDIPREEEKSLQRYPVEKRPSYSLLHQIAHITREKNALQHDDRLDALAGACRYWVEQMGINQERAIERLREKEFAEWIKNPLSRVDYRTNPLGRRGGGSVFNKYRR
ncbi:hypothetical protein [Burkholderia multivorans]|nr:hypothetical protein [Burkholderia multivorans]